MDKPKTIVLPWPPSANRLWRNMRGVMVKSDEARQYVQEVGLVARSKGYRPQEGDVKITLDFYRPRKAGDLDNRIKIVLDGLQGAAFVNDSQIVEIVARRHDDARNPRVETQIEYIAA